MKAAIELLKQQINSLEEFNGLLGIPRDEAIKQSGSLRQALAVLSAVEKVDKINCLIEVVGCDCKFCSQIRTLLESLPDKE